MDGLEGVCPRCGSRYYGWALQNPLYQTCSKCAVQLEINREGSQDCEAPRGAAGLPLWSQSPENIPS